MNPPHASTRIGLSTLLLIALSLSVSACGGDSNAGANVVTIKCSINTDCEKHNLVCDTAKGICIAGSTVGGVACSTADDCPIGEQCLSGVCGGGIQGADVAGGATDGGSTVVDGGSTVAAPTGFCAPCKAASDCGSGWQCETLLNKDKDGNENFCLETCAGDGDCAAGLTCQAMPAGKVCVHPTLRCDGCAAKPCAAGQQCDFSKNPPACIKQVQPCDGCQVDKDCGSGQVCAEFGAIKHCAPACSAAKACDGGASCLKLADGVQACTYLSETCCYGKDCKPTDVCKACPGKCVAGVCKECTKQADCAEGTCVAGEWVCKKDVCPGGKPHKDATGNCVECLDPSHCSNGQICQDGMCKADPAGDPCGLCKAPYPACAKVGGSVTCVECAKDDDCKKKQAGTCDTKTYTCSGTVQGAAPDKGECKTKADCTQKVGASKFDLECDVTTGLCYDKNGYCDNITAFCNTKKGSKCQEQNLLGQGGMPGGGGGGMPSIPGMGQASKPGMGVCSCGAGGGKTPAFCKTMGLSNCDCTVNPNGKECSLLGQLNCCQLGCLQSLSGGSADPTCFGGGKCMNIGCLFQAVAGGGGGGSSPAPSSSGYCTAGN